MAPNTDISTRGAIVAMKAASGKTTAQIAGLFGLTPDGVNKIYAKAIKRGFDPSILPLSVKVEYGADAPRSGRPNKQTAEVKNLIVSKVRRDRYGREKSCADIAGELSQAGIEISSITVWRCLKAFGFRKTKPTRKPGLTKKMKKARLAWCERHKDWTLDDWKRVMWTDETSVQLHHRRGGYRI
jgi:transposase